MDAANSPIPSVSTCVRMCALKIREHDLKQLIWSTTSGSDANMSVLFNKTGKGVRPAGNGTDVDGTEAEPRGVAETLDRHAGLVAFRTFSTRSIGATHSDAPDSLRLFLCVSCSTMHVLLRVDSARPGRIDLQCVVLGNSCFQCIVHGVQCTVSVQCIAYSV